jgi:hypothetical protein
MRFVIATVLAMVCALLSQWLISVRPVTLDPQDASDIPTVLLLLVVLNLLTVVVFVIVQSRLLAWMLGLARQPLVVPVTACGPVAAMAGYVLRVQIPGASWTLVAAPFVIGQLLLLMRLRRAVSDSLAARDLSSHSST